MAHGIKRKLSKVLRKVNTEIALNSIGGMYARGLAGEGYAGGYRAAINDVMLALNGVKPSTRGYWESDKNDS